jgi:hypothetical protein
MKASTRRNYGLIPSTLSLTSFTEFFPKESRVPHESWHEQSCTVGMDEKEQVIPSVAGDASCPSRGLRKTIAKPGKNTSGFCVLLCFFVAIQ